VNDRSRGEGPESKDDDGRPVASPARRTRVPAVTSGRNVYPQ
jgi:hypothetical protein